MFMKSKAAFLCLLLCILLLCLVGCSGNKDPFRELEKDGYTCRVTYDFGEGAVNYQKTLLYLAQPHSLIPELGEVKNTTAPVLAGYRLLGYYVKDDNGEEREWDFEKDRVTGDITLYARWEKSFAVNICYGKDNDSSYSVYFTKEKPTVASFRQVAWSGHTFYGFYYDAEYTRPVEFPYTHALDPNNLTETVYAKYLDGTYTVIRSATDFKGAINAGTNYYLEADIDLSGVSITVADVFSGSFVGNGHVINGLKVSRTQSKTSDCYGMFNQIASSAVFENITFSDVSVSVTLNNDQNSMIGYIGAFAGAIFGDAKLNNVKFSGSLTYDCGGRNLEDKLVVGEAFGQDNGVSTASFEATVTVSKTEN